MRGTGSVTFLHSPVLLWPFLFGFLQGNMIVNRAQTLSVNHSRRGGWTQQFAAFWEGTEQSISRLATSINSDVHGPAHWRAVALAGARICRSLPAADQLTVLLFSVTHDACRISDDEDPQHGHRAALSLDSLLGELAGDLAPWRRNLLAEACRYHAEGYTTEDRTIGACWDADRLCLWRGETAPHPKLMSTAPGKSTDLILWARDLHLRKIGWADVANVLQEDALNCVGGFTHEARSS
jgi:uncharacterized protein